MTGVPGQALAAVPWYEWAAIGLGAACAIGAVVGYIVSSKNSGRWWR